MNSGHVPVKSGAIDELGQRPRGLSQRQQRFGFFAPAPLMNSDHATLYAPHNKATVVQRYNVTLLPVICTITSVSLHSKRTVCFVSLQWAN